MAKRTKNIKPRVFAIPLALIYVDLAVCTTTLDPLNPVKLWGLSVVSAFALADIISTKSNRSLIRNETVYRLYALILFFFVAILFLCIFFTPVKSIALLGDTGRNLGFLNYLFLTLVALYTSLRMSLENLKMVYRTAFFLASTLTIYGFFQHFNIDFINWNNPFNPIVLMTGNPDFSASLLGLLVVICVVGLFVDFSKTVKLGLVALISSAILIIYWTKARQGLVATAAGVGFIALVLVWQRSKRGAFALLCMEIVGAIFSILGTLQIGPLTKYFYKASINDRGYDWRAALSMFKHHPFFGVGLDRYAAYFLQERSPKYPLIYGYTQSVNNSHNVFLQFFATAGLFAGLTYLALIIFVGCRAFVALRRSSGHEQLLLSGVTAGWIVFVAQSVISVDSLSISIWGWVLGGAIVGLSWRKPDVIQGFGENQTSKSQIVSKQLQAQNTSPFRSVLFVGILIITVTGVIIPMYRNETAMARFVSFGSPTTPLGQRVFAATAEKTFHQPLLNPNYKEQIASKMAENNFGPEAISYFKQTIKGDSRNTNSYSLISVVYENLRNPKEAIIYREALHKLDPYGAANLIKLENDYLLVGDKPSALTTEKAILGMAPGTDVADQAAKLLNPISSTPKK